MLDRSFDHTRESEVISKSFRASGGVGFGVLLSAVATLLFVCIHLEYEPVTALAGLAGAALACIVMRKWPMLLIAGLLFVGGFKSEPAQGISLADPTMIALLLAAGAMAMDLLFVISGTSEWSLRRLVAGQSFKILLFLLFTTILTASFLYTPAREYGSYELSRFLAFDVLTFFAPILLLKRQGDMDHFLLAMIFLGLLLVAKEILDILHPTEAVLKGNADVTRIGNGMVFSVTILILLYRRLALPRILRYIMLAVFTCGLIGSAARSPLLALVIIIIISAFCMRPIPGLVDRKKLLMLLSLTILAAFISLRWMQDRPGIHIKLAAKEHELTAMASGSTVTGGTISKRLSYYNSALGALAQHPVLGLGLGGWAAFYSMQADAAYPHNIFLEAGAEQGLIGLTVLIIFVAKLFGSAVKLIHDPPYAFLFPVVLFQVVCNSFTGNIENRELWFWFGMVLASDRMSSDFGAMQFRPATSTGPC